MDSQWHAYDDDKVRTIVAGDVFYYSCFGFSVFMVMLLICDIGVRKVTLW